jgi:hypothetical protein
MTLEIKVEVPDADYAKLSNIINLQHLLEQLVIQKLQALLLHA